MNGPQLTSSWMKLTASGQLDLVSNLKMCGN